MEEIYSAFTRLNPKLKKVKIVGFDSEDDTKGTPVSFAFYDGEEYFYTTDFNEAIDYVYNYPQIAAFCAHNLEYDIGNLFKGCDWHYLDELVYTSKLLKASIQGSKNYFLNSGSFFAGPLAKMGKVVGIEKMDGDVFNPQYVQTDARIVYEFMAKFQDALIEEDGINMGVTIGQIAMNSYRKNHMHAKRQITYNDPSILNAYYGGRVEVFYKGVLKNGVTVSDINSCYPYVMHHYPYPETAIIEKSSIETHEFGYGEFTVYVPPATFIPVLPFKSAAGRLFFPVGKLRGWWTYAEVRHAVSRGAKILKEHFGQGTNNSVRPFVPFVDHNYSKRLEWKDLKAAGNPDAEFYDLYFKLKQNNLYGKFGQHKPQTISTRFPIPKHKLPDVNDLKISKFGPFYNYVIPREKAPKTANYLWGVYITSYARIYLHEQLEKVHESGATLVYCDTDSVMYSGTVDLDIGKKLGQLDIEKFDLGVFRQAKGYLLCNQSGSEAGKPVYDVVKLACKGVPTHYALDFIIDGLATQIRKPMRLKEGLIRTHAEANRNKSDAFLRDIGVNVWREVDKEMRSIYIKRIGMSGVTKPVNVGTIPSLEDVSHKKAYSIREQLGGAILKNQKTRNTFFDNIVVPKNWFRRTKAETKAVENSETRKLIFLDGGQCDGLPEGATWFVGQYVEHIATKNKKTYLKVRLLEFVGKNVKAKNLVGAISSKFFGFDDMGNPDDFFSEKTLTVKVKSIYIPGRRFEVETFLE